MQNGGFASLSFPLRGILQMDKLSKQTAPAARQSLFDSGLL